MQPHRKWFSALSFTAALFLLTACGTVPPASAPEADDPPAQSESETTIQPERTLSYSMRLDDRETVVYLEVSEEELTLWDSPSAGQILAAARYAQPMPGAQDALLSCDFTDLDGDGNSDLTASFSFPDGSAASLTWFYADGGFVYNEEFSVLPGDVPAKGTDE